MDRIYESYLAIEPDSMEEFAWNQKKQTENLFEKPFEPFRDSQGNPYFAKDCFDTEKLGFVYDKLDPPPPSELREPPTLIIFPQVRVDQFESKCYQIHAYIIPKESESEWEPPNSLDNAMDSKFYAGSRAIFGRGVECENCRKRSPYDIIIDATAKMRELELSRYDAIVKVLLFETTTEEDVFIPLSETPLPEPILTGPLFEDNETNLGEEHAESQSADEVRALQRYLKRFGYYDDEIDGSYGPVTAQAVKDFQTAANIEVDGLAGPQTKDAIANKKRCKNKDPFAQNEVKDENCEGCKAKYGDKKKLTYIVGISPGYLSRKAVLGCLADAFGKWSKATGLEFEELDRTEHKEVDIMINWSSESKKEDNILRFDGPGGVLGHGGTGFVDFDFAERWVIGIDGEGNVSEDVSDLRDPKTWRRGEPTISLYFTALHEIGHTLGLGHARDFNDVMVGFHLLLFPLSLNIFLHPLGSFLQSKIGKSFGKRWEKSN